MSADDIKTAEQRGYSRGYSAGKRRAKVFRAAEQRQRERQAFMDKAFLQALPFCMAAQGWSSAGVPITTVDERVDLAWKFAMSAVRQRRVA